MIFFNKYKELIIIFFSYLIGNIFLLLNTDGIYWDDWTLYHSTYDTMYGVFSQASGVIMGKMTALLHKILLSIGNGIFIYRILTFILYFLVILFVFYILKSIKALSKKDIFFVTLIFSVAPLNAAKIALIDFPYTLFLTVFFFAFYLLSKNILKDRYLIRYFILFLFFISFHINSLLVFYAIVLLYIFYMKYMNTPNRLLYKLKLFTSHYLDFILLPILFFILKVNYFQPTGLYASYNSLNFEGLLVVPVGIAVAFYTSFIEPISQSFSLFYYFWIGVVVYLTFMRSKEHIATKVHKRKNYIFLFLGFLFFILAVFPYLAVGKIPTMYGFESRHQLLTPLGFSFLVYFSIRIMSNKMKFAYDTIKVALSIVILAFISQNIYSGYAYKQDWFYQVAIEEHIKASAFIRQHSTFFVDVDLPEALAYQRELSFYEQNGRLKKVFGEDTRLMIRGNEELRKVLKYKNYKQYNFSSWVYQNPINIKIRKIKQADLYFIKLLLYEFYNEKIFRRYAKGLIRIEEVEHVSK